MYQPTWWLDRCSSYPRTPKSKNLSVDIPIKLKKRPYREDARVRDVCMPSVGGKSETCITLALKTTNHSVSMPTIRHVEPICNHPNDASIHVEPVDLVRKPRGRPEILQIAVDDIGEIELLVARVDRDVVERVELTTKEIIEDDYNVEGISHARKRVEKA